MKAIFIKLLMLLATATCWGQKNKVIDSVSINFLFSYSMIFDSSQLMLKVTYKNNTNRNIEIYQYLDEGNKGDRFYNIVIEMEKLKQKNYSSHPIRFYQNPLLYRIEDSLRHFDLPRKKLPPFASDTLELNLLTVARGFLPGKYRFRVHLREKTIRDEREYKDDDFETLPPMDEIKYISSKWFYFTVQSEIRAQLPIEAQ